MSHVSASTARRLSRAGFPKELFTRELCFWYTDLGVALVSYPHNPECKTTHQSVCKKLNDGLSDYWSGDTAAILRNYTFAPTAEQIMCAFGDESNMYITCYDCTNGQDIWHVSRETFGRLDVFSHSNQAEAAAMAWLAWKEKQTENECG